MLSRFEPLFMIVAMVLFFTPLILLFVQQRDYFSWKTTIKTCARYWLAALVLLAVVWWPDA